MTVITPSRVQAGVPTGGQFASHDRNEGTATLVLAESSVANREAFEALLSFRPDATPTDFEDTLFDTWETAAEFDAYVADSDNSLFHLGPDATVVWDLPSGGVAAFYND